MVSALEERSSSIIGGRVTLGSSWEPAQSSVIIVSQTSTSPEPLHLSALKWPQYWCGGSHSQPSWQSNCCIAPCQRRPVSRHCTVIHYFRSHFRTPLQTSTSIIKHNAANAMHCRRKREKAKQFRLVLLSSVKLVYTRVSLNMGVEHEMSPKLVLVL